MIDIALFRNKSDNQPRQEQVSWQQLSRRLTTHKERQEKDGPLWSPTHYKPDTTRGIRNVVWVSCLVLDFDKGQDPEAFTRGWDHWTYAMHTTHQHTPEAPRWRVVFPLARPIAAEEWPVVWTALVRRFGSNQVDASCKDASRIYYLPSCPPGANRLAHENAGEWLDAEEFLRPTVDYLIERARGELHTGRNNAGLWLATQMRDNGYTQTETEQARWHTQVPRDKPHPSGRVDTYTEQEWVETVRMAFGRGRRDAWRPSAHRPGMNGAEGEDEGAFDVNVVSDVAAEPPSALAPEAFYGLAGDVVKAIEPHTESHSAGLMGSFLVMCGCLFGPGPHVYRDARRHAGNEFLCLVGPTGAGGKGTASAQVERLIRACMVNVLQNDDVFTIHDAYARDSPYDDRLLRGLGSGEALVEALADPEEPDKRKLVFEEEFSKSLAVMRREGSTLSQNLRSAWDGGVLANRTKGRRLEARGGHVAVLSHITQQELTQFLSATEVFNGFANRFLWFWTRRVRELPFGGGQPDLKELVQTFRGVLEFAGRLGRIEFDAEAKQLWADGGIYSRLRNRTDDFFGAITSRAATHVTRLALIYAVLDAQTAIRVPHLLAGLAVWDYSEQTCRYLFGESCGDDYADLILEILREVSPGGLTRTEIRDRFCRNAPAGRIPKALALLEKRGLVERVKVRTDGRPAEYWQLRSDCGYDVNDRYDKSPLQIAREWIANSQ